MTVRSVALDDPHIRNEILTNITEGAVMGVVVGLKGPASSAKFANAARRRGNETTGRREQDTRKVQAEYDFLTLVLLTIKSCQGFIVVAASARNVIWTSHSVRTIVSTLPLTTFDIHSCLWLGVDCFAMRIATNLEVDTGSLSTHHHNCGELIELKIRKRGFKMHKPVAECDDVKTRLIDLSKAVMLKAFVPLIHSLLTTRMSRAMRFPPTGEDEEEAQETVTIPRHPRENAVALPNQQMIDYKAKLKAAGRKPEKQKRATPEQHFDDCGENLQSILKVS